jgi:lipoate-protein ligase B
MKTVCEVFRLGQVPYMQAWRLQDRLALAIAAQERPPALLLLEHPHTYTFGRRGHAENLLWDEAELNRRGVEVQWVDRGGDITYHGPGQLVGYPLLHLASASSQADPGRAGEPRIPRVDHVGYVRRLEETLIQALALLGVTGRQVEGRAGVWVQPQAASHRMGFSPESFQPPAKIAAVGVKVDARGVTRHGFALNVNPGMSYWEGIIGCGLKDAPAASLKDFFDTPPGMGRVMDEVTAAFGTVFGFEMVDGRVE